MLQNDLSRCLGLKSSGQTSHSQACISLQLKQFGRYFNTSKKLVTFAAWFGANRLALSLLKQLVEDLVKSLQIIHVVFFSLFMHVEKKQNVTEFVKVVDKSLMKDAYNLLDKRTDEQDDSKIQIRVNHFNRRSYTKRYNMANILSIGEVKNFTGKASKKATTNREVLIADKSRNTISLTKIIKPYRR